MRRDADGDWPASAVYTTASRHVWRRLELMRELGAAFGVSVELFPDLTQGVRRSATTRLTKENPEK